MKHGAGGPARAGEGGQAGKDRAGGRLTGALCTGFTLITITCHNSNSISYILPTHNNLGVVMMACTTTNQVFGMSRSQVPCRPT